MEMKKWFVSLLVFLSLLTVTTIIGFYMAVFLIGPHSDILPEWLHFPVGIFLLIIIIGIPTWFTHKTLKRYKKS